MTELKIKQAFKDLIPPLTAEEFAGLEKSILKEGCKHPIETWNGYIIDGHHRYEICQKHSRQFQIAEVALQDEISVKQWMIRNQFDRRNMPIEVRLDLALEFEDLEREKSRKRQACGQGGVLLRSPVTEGSNTEKGKALDAVAKMANCGYGTAFQYKKLKEAGLRDQVVKGESIKKVYTNLMQGLKVKEIRNELESAENLEAKSVSGVYDVLTVDPPWKIESCFSDGNTAGYTPLKYTSMSVDEIKALDVPCADDCHVFLWTTQKFLPQAFDILSSWGLEYVCTFTWGKNGGPQVPGLPQYNTEFFLYARKGKPKFVDTKNFFTLLQAKKGKHSEKPEEFYDLLRRVTAGRRLDMFNRRNIEGFDGWGNESAQRAFYKTKNLV